MQATQGAHVGICQPQQDDIAGTRSEGLTGCPAGMGRADGLDEEQTFEGYSGGGQRRRVERLWRRDADRPAPGADTSQQGQQQAEFADPGMGEEDFGEGTLGPAAAGEHVIQPLMTRGQARGCRRRQPITTPDQAV